MNLQKNSYKVSGMTCASCAVSLESYLSPVTGVKLVSVNYPNQSVYFEFDTDVTSIETLQKKGKEIGYELLLGDKGEVSELFQVNEEKRLQSLRNKLVFAALFSLPVFVISMFFIGLVPYENWILLSLSLPVLLWSGADFFVIAWKKLLHFSASMDTLVALSTGVAFSFSLFNTIYPQFFLNHGMTPHVYYESAVVIITLILLGRYLEEKAKSKTSSAIKKLMGLRPKNVTVIRNGEELSIAYKDVVKGDLILVKPGEKIPVDGKVKKGMSFIDESMISGEPIPVSKKKGDQVIEGTINQKGSLRIFAQKVGEETLLSQIIKLVEKAQATKPKIQHLVDRIASVFVPVVLAIAILSALVWYFFGPEPTLTYAILTLITVLIIACPCALGLATPTALMVGIGKGAEQGILIKDAQVLETAYKIDVLVLDKTGTITEGLPKVTDAYWVDDDYNQELLTIEGQSEHPIAEAVTVYLKENEITTTSSTSFESITGQGAIATIGGQFYAVGNKKLMDCYQFVFPSKLTAKADRLISEAKTVIYFGTVGQVVGVFAVADKVKKNARKVIAQIQKSGIDVYMLTGDNQLTASVIANEVGINHFKAEVMPSDKGDFVTELQKQGKTVAMAGDGINDSHALAQADIGIAMGSGTDIAMESAGITLMQSDLSQVLKAINLSQSTMRTIKQNLFWAFIYNLIALPVAAGVLFPVFGFLLSPMIAGAAMSMSSISVLMNSLRLRHAKL
jgi:Cu2+-exporting ATPase